ncbi:hypothetical protein AVEN_70322-1, partial [Araneus ventricosus]
CPRTRNRKGSLPVELAYAERFIEGLFWDGLNRELGGLEILKHGQMTRTTPELAKPSPNFHATPTGMIRME